MTFVVLSIAIHGLRARLIATVAAAAVYAVPLTVSGLTALFPLMVVSLFLWWEAAADCWRLTLPRFRS